MEDDRRVPVDYCDPPSAALSSAVLDALAESLESREEVQEARVSQLTRTFDGVEVARHLVLAIRLLDPRTEPGDARVRSLMTDLNRPLMEQTGITAVSVPTAVARRPFESHGVVVFSRE
jgi:hypothetical protein